MDILTEHRDGEITVFTNNSTPEIHLTTRRAEAKEEVAENMGAVTTVADNMEDVKGAAKYAQTFDDVLLNLPTIIKAIPAAETAVQAKDDAIAAKESAKVSAQQAESTVIRAEEVTAEQVELAKGYAEQAKTEVSKISSAFKIVGTVPTVEDLPKNAEEGNIYLVGDSSITNKPEYVWTSSGNWEKFGETVDLSAYQTKEEAETAFAGKQDTLTAGEGIKIEGNVISTEGGKLPDNVYTQDNLVAGDNIEIKEVVNPNVIDDNTLLCWHFDGDTKDVVQGAEIELYPGYASLNTSYYKFGSGSCPDYLNSGNNINLGTTITDNDNFTIDFWTRALNNPDTFSWKCSLAGSSVMNFSAFGSNNLLFQAINSSGIEVASIQKANTIDASNWSHWAFTYNKDTREIAVYANGEKQGSTILPTSFTFSYHTFIPLDTNYNQGLIDELRVTKSLAWEKNFTPPTEPYAKSDAPAKKAISAIIPPVELPDDVYRQSNLLGGKDIEIVKKSGGIDEHTIGMWHFDTDGKDEITGTELTYFGSNYLVKSDFKFGTGCLLSNYAQTIENFEQNSSFTLDMWYKHANSGQNYRIGINCDNYSTMESPTNGYRLLFRDSDILLQHSRYFENNTELQTVAFPFYTSATWHHIAVQKINNEKIQVFVDGNLLLEQVIDTSLVYGTGVVVKGQQYIDELRLSNTIRWTEDFTPPDAPYEAGSAGSVINFTGQSVKNIGEVYYSQSSLASDNAGALPLFTGETIASADTIYPDFYAWVEKHNELQTTAEEYETALTTYGECPKYVISNGSLRLPKLANYIKMANATDGITQSEAGLPNITGVVRVGGYKKDSISSYSDGALSYSGMGDATSDFYGNTGNGFNHVDIALNASNSNPIYSKSDTVTPAHTTLYPWVFAYNASVPVSTAQAAEFQEGLSGKADTNLGNIPTNYDYVVESYNDGTNWYRVYKSGWIEQGGQVTGADTYTLLNPMKDTNYIVLVTQRATTAPSNPEGSPRAGAISTTQIYINAGTGAQGTKNYYVCGQGA